MLALYACLLAAAPTAPASPPPASTAPAETAQVQWRGVEHVIAFADVHGAYDELVSLLRESAVIDARDHWAAGNTHVVSLGDLVDRGPDSRKVMDLLMRLQDEAAAAGGQMHVLLGNHEAMNLMGDLRYVNPRDFAAYSDLESGAQRDAARLAWQTATCTGPCPAFDKKFPAGYFGQRVAMSAQGKYGRWLLALPVAIVLNDTLYMHGGLSPLLHNMTLQELNLRYRTALADYVGLAAQLTQERLLLPGDEFGERERLAKTRVAGSAAANDAASDARIQLVRRFESAADNGLLSSQGPNWYRGDSFCPEAAETDVLLPLLQQFGAARLVVGHTPTRNGRAVSRFAGRVVKLDAGMNHAAYEGRPAALLVDQAGVRVRYAGEPQPTALTAEDLFVAPEQLDDAAVLRTLREGVVSVVGPRAPNEFNVTVTLGDMRVPAVFRVRDAAAARRELASFKLDRLLSIGMVPATAERDVQGQHGLVQGRPRKWVTQTEVQQQSLHSGGWCSLEPQFQLLYALDVLAGNELRTPDSIFFDAEDWFVYSTGFERAFGTTKTLPAYLKAHPPSPGEEVRRRAAALNDTDLTSALGELLDARARRAILQRRDLLLALPKPAATAVSSPR